MKTDIGPSDLRQWLCIKIMYLVISTLPHLFSIIPLIKYYTKYTFGYVNIIVLSTSLSILYHIYEESNIFITSLDYLFACIWFLYDIYMADTKILYTIITGNTIIFFLNIYIPYNVYYTLNHSLWHLICAYKSYYVSLLIAEHHQSQEQRQVELYQEFPHSSNDASNFSDHPAITYSHTQPLLHGQ